MKHQILTIICIHIFILCYTASANENIFTVQKVTYFEKNRVIDNMKLRELLAFLTEIDAIFRDKEKLKKQIMLGDLIVDDFAEVTMSESIIIAKSFMIDGVNINCNITESECQTTVSGGVRKEKLCEGLADFDTKFFDNILSGFFLKNKLDCDEAISYTLEKLSKESDLEQEILFNVFYIYNNFLVIARDLDALAIDLADIKKSYDAAKQAVENFSKNSPSSIQSLNEKIDNSEKIIFDFLESNANREKIAPTLFIYRITPEK